MTADSSSSSTRPGEPEHDGNVVRGDRIISITRHIDAPAQDLFDLVADPSMHPVIDGSGSVKGSRSSAKLGLGDRFTTSMRLGVPYVISNRVVEYEEGRLLAWAHIGGWRWRFEFAPSGSGTDVTETFDWRTAVGGPLGRTYVERMNWPERNTSSIRGTLERLDAYVTNTDTSK